MILFRTRRTKKSNVRGLKLIFVDQIWLQSFNFIGSYKDSRSIFGPCVKRCDYTAMYSSWFKCLPRYAAPAHETIDDLERKYWKNVAFNPPIYGADISGTLMDSDQDIWNLNRLGTILDCVNEDYGVQVMREQLEEWRCSDVVVVTCNSYFVSGISVWMHQLIIIIIIIK